MHNLAEANVPALQPDRMTWLGEEGINYHVATQMPIFAYSSQAQGYFTLSREKDFLTSDKYAHVRSFYENPVSRRRSDATAAVAKARNVDRTCLFAEQTIFPDYSHYRCQYSFRTKNEY